MEIEDRTPSYSQTVRLKKLSQTENLDAAQIQDILTEEKPNQKEMFKLPLERIQEIAPKIQAKELESFVLKACEHYYKYLQRQKNREAR